MLWKVRTTNHQFCTLHLELLYIADDKMLLTYIMPILNLAKLIKSESKQAVREVSKNWRKASISLLL